MRGLGDVLEEVEGWVVWCDVAREEGRLGYMV